MSSSVPRALRSEKQFSNSQLKRDCVRSKRNRALHIVAARSFRKTGATFPECQVATFNESSTASQVRNRIPGSYEWPIVSDFQHLRIIVARFSKNQSHRVARRCFRLG